MELARTFLFEGQRGECGQKAFCRQIAQMDQRYTHEIETAYERLDCPVTVLGGRENGRIPIAQGHRLVELISDRPLVIIPNAGHLVQEDAPEAIIAVMLSS